MTTRPQAVPSAGPARERLRQKGQFWTPDWVAEAMVGYLFAGGATHIFDPAVGGGAFFRAAKAIARKLGREVAFSGTELDPNALLQARMSGLSEADMAGVQVRDFILNPPSDNYKAIVANPPYIRHHRLAEETKARLKQFAAATIGTTLDGRAGLHIYFLLQGLQLLDSNGRLAFIMPADTCEGVFATPLWNWITRNYCLDAVVTFKPEATPFPQVDTNALVFLIRNASPAPCFWWARVSEAGTEELQRWTLSGFRHTPSISISVQQRQLVEGLATGLSRSPAVEQTVGLTLGDFASVLRGVATGDNEFFFLTAPQADLLKIPDEFLLPAVGRTRDVKGDVINTETIATLRAKGRPTLLLALDGRPIDDFPAPIRAYLRQGEARGLVDKALIGQRRPWYKMEVRRVPPFLFAYMGRRSARFIRNLAGVTPLTSFLCVYPHQDNEHFVEKLWQVLQHPETVANLAKVGKSYGSGAIKVEPRALERLPLPTAVVAEAGLQLSQPQIMAEQLSMFV